MIAIIIIAWLALQTSVVQNWLVHKATKNLSEELGTTVEVKNVKISFFNSADIEGVLIKDESKDTLIYAGILKVRITDWFIIKDKAELKYVGLENAVIKLKRTDSIWNYQFIVDHFAPKSTKPKQTETKKTTNGFALDLKKVDLKNVLFINNDRWIGEKMETYVGSAVIDAEKVDFNKGEILLNEVIVDKVDFNIQNYVAIRPDSLKKKRKLIDTGLRFNTADLYVQVKTLKLTNGRFIDDANQNKPLAYFDGRHIDISKINGTFKNINLIKDTLRAKIELSAKERSGFEVRKLVANYRVTPGIMEFDSLDIQTDRSRIGHYYAMKYDHFNKDFGDYISKVVMVGNLKNSLVHSDDIAFFAPELKTIKKSVEISGNYKGTVDDFTVNNSFVKNGASFLTGTFSMKGLPDIDKTLITLDNGNLQTNARDLAQFIPVLKTFTNPNIAALGNIIFRGNFKGYYNDFKTTGNISTNLGSAYTDINLKFPDKTEPIYSGTLNTNKFNLGKFINNDKVGIIDFVGKVNGTSFSLNKMKATIDGTAKQLELNGYNYQNITTLGTFEKKAFTGEVKIVDPNLDFVGSIQLDFTKDEPRYNLFADVLKSNYKELKLTKDNLQLTGTIDLNFTGSNIDNFLGNAKLLNAVIKNNDVEIRFDSLSLSSNFIDNKKHLKLASNDFAANILGNFSIMDLPASFQSFLHKYYPAYINEPKTIPQNQDFSFDINTGLFEPYLKLIDNRLGGGNDANIIGHINTKQNKLYTSINVPNFSYKQYIFSGIDLAGNGNLDSLSLIGEMGSSKLTDSTYLPFTRINIRSANDHSIANIQTRANSTLNDASLTADVFTLEDGVRVQFKPSSFVINDKKWNIEKDGEFIYRSNFASTKNLKLTQGFQEISFDSENEEETSATNLNIKMKNLVIGDFIGYALKDPKLEGLASGKIELKDIFHDFTANAALNVEQLRMEEDSIGIAKIIAGYNSKTGKINWNWFSPNEKFRFSAKGSYDTKDTTSATPINNDIVLENTRLTILQKYLKGIFSNVDGYASGVLKVNGNPKKINLLGDVKVKDAGLLVDYTQVYYTIDSANIKFEEDGINFGTINIKDKFKNVGTVRGKLFEQNFKNMVFDFDVATKKMLLIDTKPKDNENFYGKAIGKATLSFKGPESNCKMSIAATANDTSHIFIPTTDSKVSADADFIVFKQIGEEMNAEKKQSTFNLSVDLDLTATEIVDIDVILDELSGDVLKATGNGRLRIKAGTNEKLDIRGRYNIDNGKYDFNFQSIIKKPFLLVKGADNFIEWTGDAYDANIHIDAQYEADNVSLSELTANTGINSSVANSLRDKVYVIAELRDKLIQPKIKFKIDFPQNSPAKTDANFSQFLRRIETDENEMLTQATSLIVFNTFTPYGQGLLSGNGGVNYTGIGINTISQKITAEINKQVSNFLYKLFRDKSLKFDIGTSVYSSGSLLNGGVSNGNNRLDRSRFNFKIGHSFLNNNVVVTFGGDLDFGWQASAAQSGNLQWLPDLNVEIVLTKDKKLRAIIFNKNSLDISGTAFGRRNRQGISISYRQEYETIFGKKEDDVEFVPVPQNKEADKPKNNNIVPDSSATPKTGG